MQPNPEHLRPGRSGQSALDRLGALDRERHLADPAIKQRYVTTLFDAVAPSYDQFTRAFSFGMDAGWKSEMVELLASRVPARAVVVDAAAGTGDLCLRAAMALPRAHVLAVDSSHRMVAVLNARSRRSRLHNVRVAVGDLCTLPLRSGSADAITVGYGFRNVARLDTAIGETARVLAPGGWLFTLDFFQPANRWWRSMFLGYLAAAGRLAGWWWHRMPATYGYIAPSVLRFVSQEAFSMQLESNGFAVRVERAKLWGGIVLHAAQLIR